MDRKICFNLNYFIEEKEKKLRIKRRKIQFVKANWKKLL